MKAISILLSIFLSSLINCFGQPLDAKMYYSADNKLYLQIENISDGLVIIHNEEHSFTEIRIKFLDQQNNILYDMWISPSSEMNKIRLWNNGDTFASSYNLRGITSGRSNLLFASKIDVRLSLGYVSEAPNANNERSGVFEKSFVFQYRH